MGVEVGWTLGPKGPCMGWRWDLRSRSEAFFFFFFFKNDTLFSFQSRTEDLTHNVCGLCPRLSIHVSSVYCSKIDVILKHHSPMFVCNVLYSAYF